MNKYLATKASYSFAHSLWADVMYEKFLFDHKGELTRGEFGDAITEYNTIFIKWSPETNQWMELAKPYYYHATTIGIWDNDFGIIPCLEYCI